MEQNNSFEDSSEESGYDDEDFSFTLEPTEIPI